MPRLACPTLRWVLAVAAAAALSSAIAAQDAAAAAVQFDRDVRPILSNHCFACHGPDEQHREGELRLDLQAEALRVIAPGDAAGSALIQRVTHRDEGERMPPAHTNKPLTAEQVAVLTRWVEQGARWAEHWSFVPPVAASPPDVARREWPRSEVDRFVLARLEREGMTPAPQAGRRALLRRVTLDLTGLPPTAADLRGFLADEAPGAYERVVDRLLATDAHAEHMARFWLDAARYGDTHGLHLDNYREMWPYRDWVVGAFRDNLPYDDFVVAQVAGDLLPDADLDQRVASGFNRCHVTTNEGGSITEEVYVRNVIDRVSTTGTVFLGLTLGCAVCHDHKFDPISQREFYELFAFFNNMDGSPMDGNRKDYAPLVRLPSAEQQAEVAKLRARVADLDRRVVEELKAIDYVEPAAPAAAAGAARREVVWVDDALPAGAEVDQSPFQWTEDPQRVRAGRRAIARVSAGNQQSYFRRADQKLRLAAGDTLFAWVRLDPSDLPRQIMLQFNDDGAAGWDHRAYWGEDLIPYGASGTTGRARIGGLPKAGEWVRLEVPIEAVGLRPGAAVHGVAITQFDGTSHWDQLGVETTCDQAAVDFAWIDDAAPEGASQRGDGRTWSWVEGGQRGAPPARSGRRVLRRKGRGLNQDFFNDAAAPLRLQDGDKLFAHVWLDPSDPPQSVQLQFYSRTWDHRVRWGVAAHGAGRANGADHRAGDVPRVGEWVRLEVDIADVGLAVGDVVDGWAFTQVGGTVYWDEAGVRSYGPPDDRPLYSMSAWEQVARGVGATPKAVRDALAVARAARTDAQLATIRDHYLRNVHAPSRRVFAPLEQERARLEQERKQVEASVPTTMVMKERSAEKDAFVLVRGLYDQKGEKVTRRTPAALPPMAASLPRDRLGLARWLTDPSHPLTARVAVNRFWQQLFGVGLVRTSEDFGNQGERPSHPALLDWLAVRFVEDGWDVRALMKRLVTSATYRQSARGDAAQRARDPQNRLLARGPRFRLDGETLRDQALALAGLLVREVGGPPVKPPQPKGLWKAVGYSSSNTANFRADQGHEKVHRRSLYTFWKRTAPPPQMTTFDAPSREECVVRRERTNTPMQALLLMNDPQYVEAARCFAQRMLDEGGSRDEDRLRWALELATCAAPAAADVADLASLLDDQRRAFRVAQASAKALVQVGAAASAGGVDAAELAAWTMVANVILNLDAVLSKD
ncbi:MAG: PSD1 and planctomycete cytochrome C domain-containing protein [Planctomycetota bacterium]|nr:PSD1 and planctomycete cytochrome C domain-containing protein [Planctomycetota bacterium]